MLTRNRALRVTLLTVPILALAAAALFLAYGPGTGDDASAGSTPQFAIGIDTNGDGTPDTAFLTVLLNAEAVRLAPSSTRAEILAQYQILERINNTP